MMQNPQNKTIADKFAAGGEYQDRLSNYIRANSTDTNTSSDEGYQEIENIEANKKGSGTRKIIIFVVIISFIVLAGIKNPTQDNSRIQIKHYLVEKINNYITEKSDSGDIFKRLGIFLIHTFVPTLVDEMINIEVSDCIFFSTFNASMEVKGEQKTLVSGIIVYGKIVPLNTDLDMEKIGKASVD